MPPSLDQPRCARHPLIAGCIALFTGLLLLLQIGPTPLSASSSIPSGALIPLALDILGGNVAVGNEPMSVYVVAMAIEEGPITGRHLTFTLPAGFELAEGSTTVAVPPISSTGAAYTHTVKVKATGAPASSFAGIMTVTTEGDDFGKEYHIGYAPSAGLTSTVQSTTGAAFANVPSRGSVVLSSYGVPVNASLVITETFDRGHKGTPIVSPKSALFLPMVSGPATDDDKDPKGIVIAGVTVYQHFELTATRAFTDEDNSDPNYIRPAEILITFDVADLIDAGFHPLSIGIAHRKSQWIEGASENWQSLNFTVYDAATKTVWGWADEFGEFALTSAWK